MVRPEWIITVVKKVSADLVALQVGLLGRSRMKQTIALLDAFLGLKPMHTVMLDDSNEWRRVRRSALAVLEPVFGSLPVLSSFPSRLPFFPMDRILDWPPGLITHLTVHNPRARLASDQLLLVANVNLNCALLTLPKKTYVNAETRLVKIKAVLAATHAFLLEICGYRQGIDRLISVGFDLIQIFR